MCLNFHKKKDLGIVKMVELLHLVCHFVMEKWHPMNREGMHEFAKRAWEIGAHVYNLMGSRNTKTPRV